MTYLRKTESPVEFILRTKYNQGKIACKKIRRKCEVSVEKQKSNRGAQKTIEKLLEQEFPGFRDHFPIQNWKQRKEIGKDSNGQKQYRYVVTTKEYEDALNVYSKNVTETVRKYGRSSNKILNDSLEQQLNLDPMYQPSHHEKQNLSETITGLIALAEKGAKSVETPDGWRVQF